MQVLDDDVNCMSPGDEEVVTNRGNNVGENDDDDSEVVDAVDEV